MVSDVRPPGFGPGKVRDGFFAGAKPLPVRDVMEVTARLEAFEKTAPETMNVAYDEDLYQKDLEYFETILGSFSLDINSVSMDSILEHFKSGKTLCAFVNTDSLQKLDDISYSVMEIPALNEELPSIGCASTDMFVVNDFSKNTDQAADFADFVTVRLTDRLHDMSGHYSVFLSQTADDAEKTE